MKIENSLQMEPPHNGAIPRILVSYYRTSMQVEEYNLVCRLITDLRSVGIDVLIDEIQDIHIPLTANLAPYDWILLIQTKDVSSFASVKARLTQAFAQNGRQDRQKILKVFVSISHTPAVLAASDIPTTFDASVDYPRAFAAIMLTVYPNRQKQIYGTTHATATPNPVTPSYNRRAGIFAEPPFRSTRTTGPRQLLYIAGIALAMLMLFGIIMLHAQTVSPIKTTSIKNTSIKTTSIKTVTPEIMKMKTTQAPTPKQSTTTAMATMTPGTLYTQVTSRTPTINDSLQSQSTSQWDSLQQQGVSCLFTNGTYHDSILPPAKAPKRQACLAEEPVFANLALQVDMQILQGDVGGIIFRANGRSSYYWFSLDSHGCYRLVLLTAAGQAQILSNDQFSCLSITMQNTNQLTVIAQNSNIYLYIDGNFIHQFSNSFLTKGQIGLMAIERTQPTTIAFSNLKVWQLT
jgi:hypothetical protein